jgi:crotonobetainyl-CoA:carnitine CoA-transferase CaiB-like acyl-CoA transferase
MARIALLIVLTLGIAIVLLGSVYSLMRGSLAGFGDAVHHLFLFMDIGIGLWIVLLVVSAARHREAGGRLTLIFAAIGVVANLVTVTVVGLIQQGGAPEFMRWALEAGLAFLVAVAVALAAAKSLVRAGRARD